MTGPRDYWALSLSYGGIMSKGRVFASGAVVLLACLAGLILFGNPDVSYRSSDGNWADSEVGFKGGRFESTHSLRRT